MIGGGSGGSGSVPLLLIVLIPILVIAVITFAIVVLSIRGKAKQRQAERFETPAGWYLDPTNSSIERYWDGEDWTAQERSAIPERTQNPVSSHNTSEPDLSQLPPPGTTAVPVRSRYRGLIATASITACILIGVPVAWLIFMPPYSSDGGAASSAPYDRNKEAPVTTPAEGVTEPEHDQIGTCTPGQLNVTAVSDKSVYAPEELPQVSLSVENTAPTACEANLGTGTMQFTIAGGTDTVWSSSHCQAESSDLLIVLEPGQPLSTEALEWDRTQSNSNTCDLSRERVPGGGSSYTLSAEVAGASSRNTVSFKLQ